LLGADAGLIGGGLEQCPHRPFACGEARFVKLAARRRPGIGSLAAGGRVSRVPEES
jgi:hypothetical protein